MQIQKVNINIRKNRKDSSVNVSIDAEALIVSKDTQKKTSPKKAEDMWTETVDIESFKDTKKAFEHC